jgi:hypothetical protein
MKYIALVYHADRALSALSIEEIQRIAGACGAWVEELEQKGKHVFSAGLQSSSTAMTLTKRDGKTSITDGPYAETKEVLGGFTIFEAKDMNEALRIAEMFPGEEWCYVVVQPVFEPQYEMSDPADRKMAEAMRTMAGAAR